MVRIHGDWRADEICTVAIGDEYSTSASSNDGYLDVYYPSSLSPLTTYRLLVYCNDPGGDPRDIPFPPCAIVRKTPKPDPVWSPINSRRKWPFVIVKEGPAIALVKG